MGHVQGQVAGSGEGCQFISRWGNDYLHLILPQQNPGATRINLAEAGGAIDGS